MNTHSRVIATGAAAAVMLTTALIPAFAAGDPNKETVQQCRVTEGSKIEFLPLTAAMKKDYVKETILSPSVTPEGLNIWAAEYK